MILTEITVSRLPKTTADTATSTNGADFADRLTRLKDRTGLTDDALDDLVAQQELDQPEDEYDIFADVDSDEAVEDEPTEDDIFADDTETDEPIDHESEVEGAPESTDPNRAGLIRTVPKAHLVYKRADPDGTFTELWSYKSTDVKDTMKVRNGILSGTDIEKSRFRSDDNQQSYQVWSVGNVELLHIVGLPN